MGTWLLIQLAGLAVVVGLFFAARAQQNALWRSATEQLTGNAAQLELLAQMSRAKHRWTTRGVWLTLAAFVVLVVGTLLAVTQDSIGRWGTPNPSWSDVFGAITMYSTLYWLFFALVWSLAILVLGPIALGRAIGLIAAHRVAVRAGTSGSAAAASLRVPWSWLAVFGTTVLSAALAVIFGVGAVACLIIAAGSAVMSSQPNGPKSM